MSINELAIAENKRRALQPAAQSGDQATEGDQTKVSVHIIIPTNRWPKYTTVNHPRIFALTIVLYAPLPLYQLLRSISFLPDILSFGITGEPRHEKNMIGSTVSSVAGGRRKHTGPSMNNSQTPWSASSTLIMAQTTLNIFASDQIYKYILASLVTFLANLVQLVSWSDWWLLL